MLRDVHPAEVVLSDGRVLTGVRAFLTTQRLIVWKLNASKECEKVIEMSVKFTDVQASRSTLGAGERLEVFSDEATAIINRGRGCGCGSPLKALSTPIRWAGRK